MGIHKPTVRLAQLIAHKSEKSKVDEIIEEILKDDNVDYQLPHDFTENEKSPKMGGCTALHIVLKDLNVEAAEKLITQDAKCTIKNSLGETALLETMLHVSDNFSDSFDGPWCHPIIDIMLYSSTTHEVFENPCNKNGLSHFHAACMVNYIYGVIFCIEKEASVDEAVNMDSPYVPGYTPLHFAARYSCFGTFRILLDEGADVLKKDAKGSSPLHLLIHKNIGIFDVMLIEGPVELSDSTTKACGENMKIINAILNRYNSGKIDALDDRGLTYLHIACISQHVSHVEQFLLDEDCKLDHSVKIDSRLWPGYTALHFAAHSGIATVKALLTKGANILAEDASGTTPFSLCLERYGATCIYSIIKDHQSWKNIKLSNRLTSLADMVYAMRSENSLEIFLQNVPIDTRIPVNSELWPGCTFLHVAIMLAGNTMHLEKIKILLDAGADVTAPDSHGTTPIHLAFHLNQSQVVNLLLQQTSRPILDLVDKRNISHLHAACAAGNSNAINRILENGVYINLPLMSNYEFEQENGQKYFFTAGSTPLHIAVITRNFELTKLLLPRGADTNARDAMGLTPIHRLLGSDYGFAVGAIGIYLFEFDLARLKNVVTGFGLSHLHVACWTDNEVAVERLLDQEADVNAYVSAVAPEPSDDLACKELQKLRRFTGYMPVDFVSERLPKKVMDIIFQRCDDLIGSPRTVLYSACYTTKSASISDFLRTHAATVERWKREWNFTALHAACHRHDVGAVEKLLKQGADPNAQISLESPAFPGLTPLHVLLDLTYEEENKLNGIIKLLIDYGADVMTRNPAGNTVLLEHVRVFGMKRMKTLVLFLKSQRNFFVDMNFLRNLNPALHAKGITHFHLACACNAVAIVGKFLRRGVDVNQIIDPMIHPFEGCTPLHLAALYGSKETVTLLLKYRANVHARNRDNETPLHCAVHYDKSKLNNYQASESVISALLSAGADLNATNIWGKIPLEVLLETQKPTSKMLKMLSKRQRYVNSFNSAEGVGYIATSISRETSIKNIIEHPIYQAVIKSPRINGSTKCCRTPIHNIVSIRMVAASVKIYTKAIEGFLKVGFDIDQQNKKGQTALDMAMRFRNAKGVAALLALGANINLSCNGETPFSIFSAFVESLDSDKAELFEKDRQILTSFLKQVYKLQLIKLEVSAIDETTEAELRKRHWNIDLATVEQCQVELERLESRKIDPYDITLIGFLSETGAVASYPEMTQQKRQAVNNFFENYSFRLRHEYPEFAGILQMQYRKAVARMTLRESAIYALDSLLDFSLPELCSSLILTFLKNSEWENLIESQEDSLAPALKRRKIS